MFLAKLKDIVDLVVQVDEKLGFKKFLRYSLIGLILLMLINYKTVIRSVLNIISNIEAEIHNEKLELRDELLVELFPLLSEFRSDSKADRILYFEYHNSKENLVSIPFKYIELVLQSSRYGIPLVGTEGLSSLNASSIASIYEDIKFGDIVHCGGTNDEVFRTTYPGVYEMINEPGGSTSQIYISIPGINQPIGMIILEWIEPIEVDLIRINEIASKNYIPRINALVLSKRRN